MRIRDNLPFEPDEALRQFILEFERTDGRMDETPEKKLRAAASVRDRVKLTNLFEARRARNLTQSQLADKSGTTRRTISAIENGRNEPSVFLALAIAEALESTVEDIFHIKPAVLPDSIIRGGQWIAFAKR